MHQQPAKRELTLNELMKAFIATSKQEGEETKKAINELLTNKKDMKITMQKLKVQVSQIAKLVS